jgi:hypothetical protein
MTISLRFIPAPPKVLNREFNPKPVLVSMRGLGARWIKMKDLSGVEAVEAGVPDDQFFGCAGLHVSQPALQIPTRNQKLHRGFHPYTPQIRFLWGADVLEYGIVSRGRLWDH